MKTSLGLLAAFALLAPVAARADGWCPPGTPPYRIEAGANAYFRIVPLNQPPLAPWYTYWPYEAQFQTPAPLGNYPYWQGRQYAPNGGPTMHMPAPAPNGGPTMHMPAPMSGLAAPPTGYQPAGYSAAPNYWYGR